jgi:hypothetical protein
MLDDSVLYIHKLHITFNIQNFTKNIKKAY